MAKVKLFQQVRPLMLLITLCYVILAFLKANSRWNKNMTQVSLRFQFLSLDIKKQKQLKLFRSSPHCRCYLHVAACRRESSRGEGRAEPRSFRPAVSRCDKAEPEHSIVPPSATSTDVSMSQKKNCDKTNSPLSVIITSWSSVSRMLTHGGTIARR